MSDEKFTQGEWTAHLGIMEPTFVHIGKEEDYKDGETPVICELYHGIKKKHQDSSYLAFDSSEMEANAALIAAAPEMYRMLEQLHGVLSSVPLLQGEIEAVLKKARGDYEEDK